MTRLCMYVYVREGFGPRGYNTGAYFRGSCKNPRVEKRSPVSAGFPCIMTNACVCVYVQRESCVIYMMGGLLRSAKVFWVTAIPNPFTVPARARVCVSERAVEWRRKLF